MKRHSGEEHVIHTADEEVWVPFDGPVPREGEHVTVECEINGKIELCTFSVDSVRWFVLGHGPGTISLSAARVLVVPV